MSKVYFKPVDSYEKTDEINKAAVELLQLILEKEQISLEEYIPLKVHFGEKGNKTFIGPENYEGIIGYLKDKGVESTFIETNVLYKGQRTKSDNHIKLAQEHGFTALPVVIADGEHGEDFEYVDINKKHFKRCKIGKGIACQKQIIVLSHFKGHILAGFGGAIKQLAMGCASIGGKLEQHTNSIPKVSWFRCKGCSVCAKHCPVDAIQMTKRAKIDSKKCIGCASCISSCPYKAITNSWIASLSRHFLERLAEYAYAAAKDKRNIYISFAFNITRHCDCEGHSMKKIAKDIGIMASIDPVAIDMACLDILDKAEGRTVFKRGRHTLKYAEDIGLGRREYELITVK